jgi:hypothetical protein
MSFTCLRPSIAIQKEEGQKPIFLHMNKSYDYEWFLRNISNAFKVLLIPCGSCLNCLKRKSQEWTARLLKEMNNFEYCYFITLTYDDEHLTDLNKRDLQLFLKRYRKYFSKDGDFKLKYYITGEYGETTNRSHYHAIFFQNKPISDLYFYANNLFISNSFSKIWSLGNCLISKQVNERTIRYTITYTLKKLGETKINIMSKGLGLNYLNENKENIKKHNGFYITDGYMQKMPSYFLRKLKESTNSADIKYLEDLRNEPKGSVKLSGSTIADLIEEFIKSNDKLILKGKGVF